MKRLTSDEVVHLAIGLCAILVDAVENGQQVVLQLLVQSDQSEQLPFKRS
jgi:hypothetical protein